MPDLIHSNNSDLEKAVESIRNNRNLRTKNKELILKFIDDSLFTRMFFWNGQELNRFELKYSNPEVRIFKVIF